MISIREDEEIPEVLPTTEECLEFHRALTDTIETETDYILLIYHFGYENKDFKEYQEKIRK